MDDCFRSARVGAVYKPGTAACLMTEAKAISIGTSGYEDEDLRSTSIVVELVIREK